MADAADMAVEIEAEHLARGLAQVQQPIPAGAAGDCEECGHFMLRLINGRCGFCRDGRTPPENWVPPTRPETNRQITKETETMAGKGIMLPASETVAIAAVEERAKATGSSIGVAAAGLIVVGAHALAAEDSPPRIDLGAVHLDALMEEVRLRVERAPCASDLEAAQARADAAESKLAALRAALE